MTGSIAVAQPFVPAKEGGFIGHVDDLEGYQTPNGEGKYLTEVILGSGHVQRARPITASTFIPTGIKVPAAHRFMLISFGNADGVPGNGPRSEIFSTTLLDSIPVAAVEGETRGAHNSRNYALIRVFPDREIPGIGWMINVSRIYTYVGMGADRELFVCIDAYGDPGLGGADFNVVSLIGFDGIYLSEPRGAAGFPGDSINLRTLGADPTGAVNASPYVQIAVNIGRPIVVDGDYLLEDTIIVNGKSLHLIGRNGSFKGTPDMPGFIISGAGETPKSFVRIQGELDFNGFEDPVRKVKAGDFQDTNIDSVAINFDSGCTRDEVYIGPGVSFTNCRTGIRAAESLSAGLDGRHDYSIDLGKVTIEGATFEGGARGIGLACKLQDVLITGCTFRNLEGGMARLSAIRVAADFSRVDGTPMTGQEAVDLMENMQNVRVIGNLIDGVLQKKHFGDSTPGNAWDCVGIAVNGYRAIVAFNIINRVTGVNYDCEGIYTKAVDTLILGNRLYDSGGQEGAINAGGSGLENLRQLPDGTQHLTLGYAGDRSMVRDNSIIFPDGGESYTHTDGVTINMKRDGICCYGRDFKSIKDNYIQGGNSHALIFKNDYGPIYGGTNDGAKGFRFQGNQIVDWKGREPIYYRGGFNDLRIENNSIRLDIPSDTPSSFIRLEDGNLQLGTERKNGFIRNNYFENKNNNVSGSFNLIEIDGSIDLDGLLIENNTTNVTVNSGVLLYIEATTAGRTRATNFGNIRVIDSDEYHLSSKPVAFSDISTVSTIPNNLRVTYDFNRRVAPRPDGYESMLTARVPDGERRRLTVDFRCYRVDAGHEDEFFIGHTVAIFKPTAGTTGNDANIFNSKDIDLNEAGSMALQSNVFEIRQGYWDTNGNWVKTTPTPRDEVPRVVGEVGTQSDLVTKLAYCAIYGAKVGTWDIQGTYRWE